ncbi:CALLOSE SYNTHASE 9 [Salix koriyanagi]|uniref:CALLOSE SYNTHASE 9 n=1 Tax=Salix koriyanagi TaxID=2511006 RepID=A0A9Q0PI85_9ROSI|nr:CALLOSE SYNTHASE 9 [Salix koriyanagi]
MYRVSDNWERLVRAALRRELGHGHEKTSSGIAGAVPASLVRSTNIDAILQAADEIQDEDPNVARILCEQAYSMAQNLDPSSDGRGVLQFKTGLMSVIKQKLAKRDGARIDRNRDIEHLWEFYQRYKTRYRVDDIQREGQKFRESGNFATANLGEFDLRSLEMKKVFATLRALVEVMEALSKDADPHGVGRYIMEELQRIKSVGELATYNIVPLEAPSLTNAIGVFPEVRGAISAIRYAEHYPRFPAGFKISGEREVDMFDLLEYVFGFQNDNVRNQRENIILSIANAQSRLGLPIQEDPKIDEKAINEVFLKVLDNYIKWCKYLRKRLAWNSIEAINRDRKIFMVSLYFLIWGEAANVRFLPECICYIFHQMAKELDAILDHGEANRATSCITESDSVSFLEKIICPIYKTIVAMSLPPSNSFPKVDVNQEAESNNNGKAAHSAWRNYDDFNEYFWSPTCFDLGWPMKEDSSFLFKPKKSKRVGW